MFEDDLRETFARYEELTPATGPLRAAIDRVARRRRRRRLTLRATGAALAVLVAVSVPIAIRDLADSPAVPAASVAPTTAVPDRPLNFLLLGLDYRAGSDHARADTIMIVHVPQDRSAAYLVSIPRDLAVEIPGYGRGKINSAFFYGGLRRDVESNRGGAQLVQRVLTEVTGLRFDGSVALTFTALRKLTDAVGGVRLCLDRQVTSIHSGHLFPAGCQHLDGRSAMDLLRQRRDLPEGGHDRDRNGQRFVRALLAETVTQETLTDPAKVYALLRAAGGGLTLDTGGLPLTDLLPVVQQMIGAEAVGIGWSFQSTESSDGVMRLDPELSATLFAAMRRDTLREWVRLHPRQVTP